MKKSFGTLFTIIAAGSGIFWSLGFILILTPYTIDDSAKIYAGILTLFLGTISFAIAYFCHKKMVVPAKNVEKEIAQEKLRTLEERKKQEKFIESATPDKVELINVLPEEKKFKVYDEKKKIFLTYGFESLLGYEVKMNDKAVQWKSLGAGLMTPAFSNAGMQTVKKVDKITVFLKLSDFDNPVLPVTIYSGIYLNTNSNAYTAIEEKLMRFTTYLDIIQNKTTN